MGKPTHLGEGSFVAAYGAGAGGRWRARVALRAGIRDQKRDGTWRAVHGGLGGGRKRERRKDGLKRTGPGRLGGDLLGPGTWFLVVILILTAFGFGADFYIYFLCHHFDM
jgi:hypothetical protein